MSLSLKLELKADNKVLVTNSETTENKEVTIGFLQEITGDSLLLLAQYRSYELIIDADRHWQRILSFNPKLEQTKEMLLEQKFRNIMLGDRRIEITDCEREMYTKALAWIDSYNSNTNRKRVLRSQSSVPGPPRSSRRETSPSTQRRIRRFRVGWRC
ncbi:hypothetical protein [Myxosarcina sp. GI1(2024)]